MGVVLYVGGVLPQPIGNGPAAKEANALFRISATKPVLVTGSAALWLWASFYILCCCPIYLLRHPHFTLHTGWVSWGLGLSVRTWCTLRRNGSPTYDPILSHTRLLSRWHDHPAGSFYPGSLCAGPAS
jgi:hypothetical protein